MDIWKSEKWKTFYNNKKVRTGLYTRFDNRIPPEIKWPCYMFCEWVREYYEFPIRLPIYFKVSDTVRTMDGGQVSGKCSNPYDRLEEPHITIATGAVSDFEAHCQNYGLEDAIFALLCTISHELTHYYQWINDIRQGDTEIERQENEREAEKLGEKKVYEYLIDLGMSQLTDTYYEWKEYGGENESI